MNNDRLKEGYKQTAIGLIPEDWDVVPLGSFLNFQNGVNASKASYGHGIPFINISEVMAHTHLTHSDIPGLVFLSKKATDLYRVYQGDILFNRTSEVQEELGLTSVYLGNEIVVFGGFVIRGRQSTETFDMVYSSYALRSPSIRNQVIARGQGVVRANIGQKDLSEIQICVPPLPEQRSLAQALSDVDDLIASLDKLIAKKRHLKTATMQQLLTGKKRLPGFGEGKGYKESAIGVIPEDWEPLSFGDVVSFSGGSQPPRSTFVFKPRFGYLRLIQIRDYKTDAYASYIPEELAKKTCTKNDVMIGRYGPPIFQILRGIEGAYNVALIKAIPSERINKEFLYHFIKNDDLFRLMEMLSQRSSGQTGVELPALREYPLALPSLSEQRAIATVLSDMDGAIAALESRLAKTQAIKQGMMQQLLTGKIRLKIEE
jgi:type I restriction enzyme, S subunit